MNIEYNLTNLFAVPVFNTVINGITDYDKISLTNIEYERSDYNSCSISENKYILEDQKYSFIKSKILEKFEFYVRDILQVSADIDFYMTNSWIIKHKKGDKAVEHNHVNSILSGVYYLNVDENSGDIVFHRNSQDYLFGNLELPVKNWNIYNSRTWKYTPQNNGLIFFPSTLKHSVTESFSNIDRYVLAFNFFIKGRFGEDISTIDIK